MKWLLGSILLLAVGLVFQLGLLVYSMYVLLGVMAVSRYLSRQWLENASADRECSRLTAEIGEQVAVVVKIRNRGRLPIPWVLVEDSLPKQALLQLPPRIRVHNRRFGVMQLGRQSKTLLYKVEFLMRGYYQIGPLMLETGDLFGLHRRYKVVTDPHFILVYPKVVPLDGYDLASRRPIGEVRITHRLFEDPTRISGVRLYQNGDPLNRVHWRATARTGELHCKTFEPSSVAGATILLDFHTDRYRAQAEPHCSELAVTAAASLANTVYRLGQQIGFFTNGRDAVDRIVQEGWKHEFHSRDTARDNIGMREQSDRLNPVIVETRRGAGQLSQILETLARVELTDGFTFAQLVMETASRLPRDATVVAVLSEVTVETAIVMGDLRRGGYAVSALLVMPDDDTYAEHMGRLLAEGIAVRAIEDETSLAVFCSQQMVS